MQTDLNGDGVIDAFDLSTLLSQWGDTGTADFNQDGMVDTFDLSTMLADWGVALTPIYRVNAGGPVIQSAALDWGGDSADDTSPFVFGVEGNIAVRTDAIDMTNLSLPPNTPEDMFRTERYDVDTTTDMVWRFPVAQDADHLVRLYFAEGFSGAQAVGERVFDVYINGATVLTGYDTYAEVGGYTGQAKEFFVTTTTEEMITVTFTNPQSRSPRVMGLEVLSSEPSPPPPTPTEVSSFVNGTDITVSWAKTAAAESYSLKRATASGGPYTTVASDVIEFSYTDSNLNHDTMYHYVVVAVNAAGESVASTEVSETTGSESGTLIAGLNVDAIPLGTMGATAITNSNYWTTNEPITFHDVNMTKAQSGYPTGYRFRTIVQENIFGYSGRVLRCEMDDDAGPRFMFEYADAQTIRISFYIAFSTNFRWSEGNGKFPGIYSRRDPSVSIYNMAHCDASVDPQDGFSARHVWLRNGGATQYLYAQGKKKDCGDTYHFDHDGRSTQWPNTDYYSDSYDRMFESGRWYFVEQEIDVGNRDGSPTGTVTSWVDGVRKRQVTGIPLTDGFGIRGFWHSSYYYGAHSVTDAIYYHSHKVWRVA